MRNNRRPGEPGESPIHEIVDHNGVPLVVDPFNFIKGGTMSQDDIQQLLDLFKNALEKGHRYVLCVECESKSTLRQSNIEDEADVARFLEKFARRAREAA